MNIQTWKRAGAVSSASDFGPKGSLVRSPSGASSFVALSKSGFHSSLYIAYICS